MNDFSFFSIIQIIAGAFLILESFGIPGWLKKMKWFENHRVDKSLMLFGGTLLLMYGIWNRIPNFFN